MSRGEGAGAASTWVAKSCLAIDGNAFRIRVAAIVAIVLMSLNPLLLVALRGITGTHLPDVFCSDFVLDIDGKEACSTDKSNTGLFLKEILVSGQGCKGALSAHLWTAPIISVWASNTYDLSKTGVEWHLVTSPNQAGLNTLYPTADKRWSWVVESNSAKPSSSPLGAVASTPGSLNLVACLERNPDLTQRVRGMKVIDFPFRSMCTNIATWCGSACNYQGHVVMPTCDLSTHAIIGTTWVDKYVAVCASSDSRRLASYSNDDKHQKTTDDATTDDADDLSKFAFPSDTFSNVSWSFGVNDSCTYAWTDAGKSTRTSTRISEIDGYDIYAVAFTVFFDALAIFSFLPLLPYARRNPHHGSYAKRMLEFLYGKHEAKLIQLIASGNIRALVFLTARVTEPEFDKQMESTCKTMKYLADRLVDAGMSSPLKLIVKVIDEERTAESFEELVFDHEAKMSYYRTPLLKLIERISSDPRCDWFPSGMPILLKPIPGGHYRQYTKIISTISFEVHYMRRGWRPERSRSFFENTFGFGERAHIREGDNVVFNNGPGEENGLGTVQKVSLFGGVTVLREVIKGKITEEDEVQVPKECVRKMIEGAGKGSALGQAYDVLRTSLLKDIKVDYDSQCGNMLVCVLDARHHVVAQRHFWNTLVGAWWIEEEYGFDDELQFVQVAQNLKPPQHFFLGQQNKMWYSFLSSLLGAVGAVTSSGSGSITKIPLDTINYRLFKDAALALKSNTEDYLQSIIMLSRGGTGAYVCNYDYTTAKGKDTMLSAYLRWEGGNFAVCSKGVILRQAFIGTIWLLTFCSFALLPLIVLLATLNWTYAVYAAVVDMGFFILMQIVFTSFSTSAFFVHTVTVQIMALRSILNPFMGVLGALFLFSLPLMTYVAGHVPLQLSGVTFPWTLLLRAFVLTIIQGVMYSGVYATEQIRNDVMKEVLQRKFGSSNVHLSRRRLMLRADMSQRMLPQSADADLDRDLEVDTGKAWSDAIMEFTLQATYQMNQLSLQPGKGLMSCLRGLTEIVSRECFSIDASGWVSGKVERVVFGIPIANEAFILLVLLPYTASLSRFLSFTLLAWMSLTTAFVWVEEIIAPNLPGELADPQIKKGLHASIVLSHLFFWFYMAGIA